MFRSKNKQICVIFTHLKLCLATATHNFKCVKNWISTLVYFMCHVSVKFEYVHINPFKPEFMIFIFIHHKPRIAVAILDL